MDSLIGSYESEVPSVLHALGLGSVVSLYGWIVYIGLNVLYLVSRHVSRNIRKSQTSIVVLDRSLACMDLTIVCLDVLFNKTLFV